MITGYFEVVAIRDHKPIHQSQLQFKKGEKILVVETAPTGWWKGEIGARKGLFPESYVSTVSDITSPLPSSPLVNQSSPAPIAQQQKQTQQTQQTQSPIPAPTPVATTVNTTNSGSNTPVNIPQFNISSGSNSNSSSTNSSANNTLRNTTSNNSSNKPNGNVSFSEPPAVTITLATISPIDSPSVESPANHSPRFNISKSDIENSTPLAKHSRKNSGPSKSISSLEFSNDDYNKDTDGTNTPSKKYSSATVNVNPYKESASSQQKVKSRTPLNQNVGRITVEDVNTQVPYYISRAIEPHVKQSFDELEFSTGDLVVIYNSKDVESDWWVGRIKNTYGVFQKKCVEIIKDISPSPEPILSNKTINNSVSTTLSNSASPSSALPPTHPNSNHNPASQQSYINSYSNSNGNSNNSNSNNSNNNSFYNSPGNSSFMRNEMKKAIAIGNYNSQFATYLSFKKGDILVLESKEGEFWKARIGAHIGLVSPNYIREIENNQTSIATVTNNNISQSPNLNNNNNYNHNNINNNISNNNISNNNISNNNVNNSNNSPIVAPTKHFEEPLKDKTQTPTQPIQDNNNEDEAIAKKIRDSFLHFQSKEELLEAIQNLAIKFVKQSAVLKKELAQEQSKRLEVEEELKIIKQKYNIN